MRQSEHAGEKGESKQSQVRARASRPSSMDNNPGRLVSHGERPAGSSFSSERTLGDTDVFLTVRDIELRYGIGRTRAYQLVKEAWFPEPVVKGSYRWSLTSLQMAEAAKATGGFDHDIVPPQPKRRRRR